MINLPRFSVFALFVCFWLAAVAQCAEEQANESWTQLAAAGFDLEQLDGIRGRNSRPLTAADGQPMIDLQAAVAQWDANQFEPIPPLSLLDLLADTRNSVCRRVQMIGRVRQCLRIKAQPALPNQSDLFQLTIFPDLDGQQITIKSPAGKRVPYGRFAVTVRASELPRGETEKSLMDKRIRVNGFHYRFWRYDSVFANQQDLKGQVGALVIAGPVEVLTSPPTAVLDDGLTWLLSLLAIGLVTMGWWYGRATLRNDRSYDALPDLLPDDWQAGDGDAD